MSDGEDLQKWRQNCSAVIIGVAIFASFPETVRIYVCFNIIIIYAPLHS